MNIDLKELAKRESERVEWKENVADIASVVKTIVAFSNDFANLGGGYVVCGAKETKDKHGFQAIDYSGLTSSRLLEIENKTLAHCRDLVDPGVVPLVEVLDSPNNDSTKILVLIVPSTGNAHSYRAGRGDSSKYYIRSGSNTIEARNGILRELLISKNQLAPWDKRINKEASVEDIDLVIFRDYLQEMKLWSPNKALEDYLSESERISEFLPPLVSSNLVDQVSRPKNFTLLMFGKQPLKFFSGAYSIFSIYRGNDRSEKTAERLDITGTVVQQARKLIELLNTESFVAFDKETTTPNQVKYPIRALQEAVINALVHRDYESSQPIRITGFNDRIEINSPGTLPRAIEKEKFVSGKAHPHWKNQTLAYFFNKLQLAQAEGQGIPTILRTMQEEGCPDPIFEVGPENLICILPAHPRHKINRELYEIENRIVIGNYDEAYNRTKEILINDPYNYRAIELFCEINNLRKTPDKVYNFLINKNVSLDKVNSRTLVKIADTLSLVEGNPKILEYANQLLAKAVEGQLEEKEIVKIAINLKRLGNAEKVIEFVDEKIEQYPSLSKSSALLEERGRAKINLAKNCIDTGRDKNIGYKIRGRAWEECRRYLKEAESDLNNALQNARNPIEKDYILRDIEFLEKMKEIAKKPKRKGYKNRPKQNS